jgi:ubiquinone/menaquinone biosynthesis C-methylase UbiE
MSKAQPTIHIRVDMQEQRSGIPNLLAAMPNVEVEVVRTSNRQGASKKESFMATPDYQPKSDNVYISDPESGAEMARLIDQDRLITKGMGGLFPERSNDFSGIHRVLNGACGPGGWALEIAFKYPEIEVVGFDVSQVMIDYANAQARVQGLENASFQVMNLLKPLEFPDNSFDLSTVRFVNFLPAAMWPRFVRELARVTCPGGFIRLTESEWWYFSTSPALETLNSMVIKSVQLQGGYSQTGRFTGILPLLGNLLRQAGCVNITLVSHVIDFSYGTDAYEGFRHDASIVFKLFQPFIIRMQVASQSELDDLYHQMVLEMLQEDFHGLLLPLTALGEKAHV